MQRTGQIDGPAFAMPPDRTLCRADGRTITYLDINPTAPRALIHMHGGGTSRFEGLLIMQHAVAHGWRVIVPDRPGYGQTSPLASMSLMAAADDVTELAHHLGLARFALSGWSAGGPAAAAAAIANRNRITGIAVINSAGDPHNPAWRALSAPLRALLALCLTPLVAGMMRPLQRPDWIARLVARQWRDEPAAASLAVKLALDRMFAEGARQGPAAFEQERALCYGGSGWGFTYADPACPVIFIHGVRDMLLPFVRAVQHVTPRSRLIVIPGGHLDGGRAIGWTTLFSALEGA